MFKFLWLDTETTGLDPVLNDVIQIAGIIVSGKRVEKFEFKCRPLNPKDAQPEALAVHGISLEEMMKFPDPRYTKDAIISIFKKYVNNYDKSDKFVLCGQNVGFDNDMMHHLFQKNGDKYWFSWVHRAHFDTINLAMLYELRQKRKVFKTYKLEEMCKTMGVDLLCWTQFMIS